MSIALYRKYRSATFAELIGQEHVASTLRNEVRRGEVSHAYLFAGIRGTGKTSAARILARAVTCLHPQDGEPDNVCDPCLEVLGGAAVDVLEIDAASNRGIDEMRDLREKVKFLPASLSHKVYIVDEAHMLTTEAWNAFLKTLEEPPPHVIFILATTEPHKVPETVRSRVQRFDFRRVDRAAVAAHLASVAAREEVLVDADAVDLLARSGQGSVRDSLSLLDQAIATGERPVNVAAVRRALGLADPAAVRAMLLATAVGDGGGALRAAAAAFDAGADARALLREAGRLARSAELVALGYPEGADLAGEDAATCAELATAAPRGLWVEALERFAEAEINLRQPVDARLQVELCLLRLCSRSDPDDGLGGELEALRARLSALEAGGTAGAVGVRAAPRPEAEAAEVSAAPGPEAETVEVEAIHPDEPVVADGVDVAEVTGAVVDGPAWDGGAAPAAVPGAGPQDVAGWAAGWNALVDVVNRRDPMLAGVLRSCRPVEAGPGRLVVGAPYGFHLEKLRETQKVAVLVEAATAVAGTATTVEAAFAGGDAQRPAQGSPPDGPDLSQAALAAFPGSRITGSRLRDPLVDQPAG